MKRVMLILVLGLLCGAGCSGRSRADSDLRLTATGHASFLLTDALYLFPEAQEKLVGFARDVPFGAGNKSFAEFFDPRFTEKTDLGIRAGVEQMIHLRPTHVVLKQSARRLAPTFEEVGIQPVFLDLETPESFHADLVRLGELFGNPVRAAQWVAYYAAIRKQALNQTVKGLEHVAAPRVLLLQLSSRGGGAVKVPPADWMQTRLVEMAGGIPVWKDSAQGGGWQIIGSEQAASWNPDVILLVTYDNNPAAAIQQLVEDPNWNHLRAVQTGRLHVFPADFRSWDLPGVRWGLGLLWVGNQLWPDQTDMEAEIIRFYGLMGIPEERVRAEILPMFSLHFSRL